ncbi:hypothetical protein [Corynebacterium ammoniagenes]|jgi:hypothetical protein|uniref:Molecular chaperone GrpE n=2 Tax=Corynebacterium ammoniagenes TaxID=1697 RepID=A0AAV5G986_CORAM|nr:hypothetical protein [Corynebacterium ammoniagenes]APT82922.1 protein GrpE [Corynebacterium ammoniagenes DSM 20306]AQS73969.1 molecular chaperone GrpE [Corynebacterium ammoniagenes]EFG80643.1 hypothetical protein HMPREF0281_02007 [Corynebacterium ammoniagenes DSM 20306]NMF31452.1 molecular chaperone GrpE [Corynebacterium ammoniagenes]GJN42820.1 hypothetical protein CAT723_12990 [Corynebacterium ammoniagenes]
MMSQELFERPEKQYEKYSITAFPEESKIIGDPAQFESAEPTEEQEAAMESILESHPEAALTFDETTGLWIIGEEDNLEAMFADRDALVDALESDDGSARLLESD